MASDDERERFYPRQWWSASSNLRLCVRTRIRTLTHELCDAIANDESMQAVWVDWIKPITKEWNGEVYTLGYIGKLSPGWECLLEANEAEHPSPTSEAKRTLDSPAKIRIKRRQIALENGCPRVTCLRSESVKAGRVKGEREILKGTQMEIPYPCNY